MQMLRKCGLARARFNREAIWCHGLTTHWSIWTVEQVRCIVPLT